MRFFCNNSEWAACNCRSRSENEKLEFSGGFTDLHTQSYQRVLEGKGYGVEENRAAIETVEVIRVSPIVENPENPHPLLAKVKKA